MKQTKRFWGKNMWLLLIYLLFVLVIPLVLDNYLMTVINACMIYFIVALGLSIMLGMGGQMNFASVSFMGLAAFLSVQISKRLDVPVPLAMLCAVLVTCMVAFWTGLYFVSPKGGILCLCNHWTGADFYKHFHQFCTIVRRSHRHV